jgi:hypothetical protein
MQNLGGGQRVRATVKFINADGHSGQELIGETQQPLLDLDWIEFPIITFTRRLGAEGCSGDSGGALEDAAAGTESHQEAQ